MSLSASISLICKPQCGVFNTIFFLFLSLEPSLALSETNLHSLQHRLKLRLDGVMTPIFYQKFSDELFAFTRHWVHRLSAIVKYSGYNYSNSDWLYSVANRRQPSCAPRKLSCVSTRGRDSFIPFASKNFVGNTILTRVIGTSTIRFSWIDNFYLLKALLTTFYMVIHYTVQLQLLILSVYAKHLSTLLLQPRGRDLTSWPLTAVTAPTSSTLSM